MLPDSTDNPMPFRRRRRQRARNASQRLRINTRSGHGRFYGPYVARSRVYLLNSSVVDDGLVPSTASTANASGNERRPKGGGRGFTQDESAAVEEQLIKDGLYDASTGRFSRRYWSLKSHLRPSGRGYWLPLAKKGPFAKRNENNLRKYFSKHYGHLL